MEDHAFCQIGSTSQRASTVVGTGGVAAGKWNEGREDLQSSRKGSQIAAASVEMNGKTPSEAGGAFLEPFRERLENLTAQGHEGAALKVFRSRPGSVEAAGQRGLETGTHLARLSQKSVPVRQEALRRRRWRRRRPVGGKICQGAVHLVA